MSDERTSYSIGCGPSGGMGTIFIVLLLLKVFHVVDWSWWIITMPLWIGAVSALLFFVVGGTLMSIALSTVYLVERFKTFRWRRRRSRQFRRVA